MPLWLAEVNEKAGAEVYCDDGEEPVIRINDPSALTLYEQYAILATYTADQNFYVFAAEVEIHAEVVSGNLAWVDYLHSRALHADMGIYEEPEPNPLRRAFDNEYYNMDSLNVINHELVHRVEIEG